MKKIITLLALAALFASCSSTRVIKEGHKPQVLFNAHAGAKAGYWIKGNAIHFQQRADAKKARELAKN